ncbi:hypothetical protein ACLOJK_000338 [Asimina triloba]
MVTPLGCGVDTAWKRLIDGGCGIRALSLEDLKMDGFDKETKLHTFEQLTSKVAAIVPSGTSHGEFNEEIWLNSKVFDGIQSIARFISYALCSAHEALKDANWMPDDLEKKERTGVSIGGGIGSMSDILDVAQMICEKRLRRLSPFFVPRILINMAAGHVSMKYGFQELAKGITNFLSHYTFDVGLRGCHKYTTGLPKSPCQTKTPLVVLLKCHIGNVVRVSLVAKSPCQTEATFGSPGIPYWKCCERGPNHAVVTACASGAHSIGDAARMIQFGDSDVMLAGGTESSIDALSIAGFCRDKTV